MEWRTGACVPHPGGIPPTGHLEESDDNAASPDTPLSPRTRPTDRIGLTGATVSRLITSGQPCCFSLLTEPICVHNPNRAEQLTEPFTFYKKPRFCWISGQNYPAKIAILTGSVCLKPNHNWSPRTVELCLDSAPVIQTDQPFNRQRSI